MIWPGVQNPHCRPSWAIKACLDRMQPAALRHAFDGENVRAVVADGERQTGIDPPPVDDDRAGAALAAVAPLLGAGQVQPFAQQIEQRDARDRRVSMVA